MRSTLRRSIASRRLAAACSAFLLLGASQASAQTPADSVRADTSLSPLIPPRVARAVPRIPTADTAPALDTTYLAAPLTGVATPTPTSSSTRPQGASPALPRVELISTQRPVVLVRGAGAAQPAAPSIESARVQVDAEGRRTLVYSERPAPPPDIGTQLGCGPGAERAIIRLGNLWPDTLILGDEGPLVGAAQQVLCIVGYDVPPDGRFDLEMEAAILEFQAAHNATAAPDNQIIVSGILDESTSRALQTQARARLTTP